MSEYLTPEGRWNAVQTRDQVADGQFYYGVSTTRIYCRPSCPSRRPKRENISFYDSPQEAYQAGLRPCLRCQPDELPARLQVVAQVKKLLDTESEPTLTELAAAVNLSPAHLQRLFKRETGLSPKQYAIGQRTARLRPLLRGGQGVTPALYDAGFGTSSTAYYYHTRHLGMTPGQYASGGKWQVVGYTLLYTPLGTLLVAATTRGLCAVRFGEPEALRAELHAEFPRADLRENANWLASYTPGLQAYLSGEEASLNLPTDAQGTAFQQRVWQALQAIPTGETRSYAQLAAMLGEPKAVRAVASACARNPVALVVPCHRIIRSGGTLGGYRWGLERKARLLEIEQESKSESAP